MDFDTMQVKCLGFRMAYPKYKRLQAFLLAAWILVGLALIPFSGNEMWILSNGWWLCLAMGIAEALESILTVSAAKKRRITDKRL